MFNLFKKNNYFESVKIIEDVKDIHNKLSNPSCWSNSIDTFLNILSHSKRISDIEFSKKNYSKALKLYLSRLNNGAINLNEDKSFLYLKIGNLFRLLNEDEKAIVSYKSALEINPDLDSSISCFSVLIDRKRSNSSFM
ncbi:hypothetical protein HOK68_01050 [Candidatus Woesearchaeota archaeon]|jgi:tetratricopeptide (TPR) repeat protein|nr:hypothetical protein [Candidatus Woesearchaeota archaeon]MBT4387683.1 hypothetical protein [Candidatus Woesearchaeota archaeon]MBT4595954.1 hypothetical protein [Candidatus Woesearchaeota archaeon]MBT5741084.1 hypothetical protein [Candidatus Woesearchaeota archaeon]MBT6505348.1 hypothetical protein [Candidatus Woesearchaeota archaeon]